MSGVLLAADQAAKLLDEVIYERVLDCIDLEALFRFEQALWFALHECGADDKQVSELAQQMIDRALQRVPDEPRRYAAVQPFGDCPLCVEEQPPKRTKRKAS